MAVWRKFSRGLRALLKPQSADQDIADEVESYLEHATADLVNQGLSPGDARRAAQLNLGSSTAVREQVRSSGWENSVAALLTDVRYAVRRLRGNPGFTAATVLTLALGIGATSSIFTVIHSVLLKPLPYRDSGRLVALLHTAPGLHIPELNLAASLFFTYSEESRAFQDVSMWTPATATVSGVGVPEVVPGLVVTSRFLPALAVQPIIGRGFTASDDQPKTAATVMLTDAYWQSRFGGDHSVVGRRLVIDGDAREVIGVLPPTFQFMDRKVSILTPLQLDRSTIRLISFCCQGVARLKPGVTLAQANADVARMLPMAPLKFPMNPGFSAKSFTDARIAPRVRLLKDVVIGDIGNTLWVLMGTVGIVLLIACANVANLLLVRADGRRQELAVRAALGAGAGRIARELMLESLLLNIAGGAVGLALAVAALRLLVSSGIEHLPRVQDVSVDPTATLFTIAISLATGLLFGLIPVFKYARPQISGVLRGGGRALSSSRERHRTRSLLVIFQVALALVLLIGSGLMLRTFQALRHIDPGVSHVQEVETLRISIPETQVKEPERVVRMEQDIIDHVRSRTNAPAAAIISDLPLEGGSNDPVYAQDQPPAEGALPPIRRYKFISPVYFSAAGTRLIAGRDFTWAEMYGQRPVAVVSENMAREFWHDPHSAIGKRIRPTLKDDWCEVVGVAADLRDDGIEQKAPGIVYWPLLRRNFESSEINVVRDMALVIRTPRAGSAALRRELPKAVAGVDLNLPVAEIKTLESVYNRSLARTSTALALLAIAGCMALLLGLVGIYGVISYAVSQRAREIGIRLALGCQVQDVTRMFVRYGLLLSGMGALCGLATALVLTRLMRSLLYQVSPVDPITYGGVAAVLILMTALASYLPARRASGVDPVEALRAE